MELSDLDQGPTSADIDQALSEEQTYRETMREASDPSWVMGSVNIPTDDWLCKKLDKLTLVEAYPSRSLEAAGLQCNQYTRTAKSQD